jgi:hypothetical protein
MLRPVMTYVNKFKFELGLGSTEERHATWCRFPEQTLPNASPQFFALGIWTLGTVREQPKDSASFREDMFTPIHVVAFGGHALRRSCDSL